MTLTMYDAVPEEIPNIPANPQAVGGYVDGFYVWSSADWDRFPHAHHLTIAAHPSSRARCLDVEAGDATPAQAPGWYVHLADHTHGKPVLYCSASIISQVTGAMAGAGVGRSGYLIWSAHYGQGAHVCGPRTCGYPQADGTQWNDTVNGRSCDVSQLPDSFFTTPPPPRPAGIARFAGSYDLAKGHWNVHGTEGHVSQWDHIDRWASVEIQINQRTGQWRSRPLPFNAAPLGR